jgi:hypothetical protein
LALVEALDAACRRASAGGVRLTHGQAFYRLVASGTLPNTAAARKQFGVVAGRARMAGLLDWELLVDGTNAHHPPSDGVQRSTVQRSTGRRSTVRVSTVQRGAGGGLPDEEAEVFDPPGGGTYREVWIEKDGLAEVVAPVAAAAGIGWTSCGGLPSLALLHEAALRFAAAIQQGEPGVLLYLGDLDAHGSVVEREVRTHLTTMVASHHLSRHQDLAGVRTRGAVLARVLEHMRIQLGGAAPLTFQRVALTRAQAQQLHLPDDGAGGWEIEAADPLWLRSRLTEAIEGPAAVPGAGPAGGYPLTCVPAPVQGPWPGEAAATSSAKEVTSR